MHGLLRLVLACGLVRPGVPTGLLTRASQAEGFFGNVRLRSHSVMGERGPSGQRGLVLAADVPKDTLVLYIPASLRLTLDTSSMPERHREQMRRYNQYVQSALAILFEQKLGRNSSNFWPYIASLPREPPRNMFYLSQHELATAGLANDVTTLEVLRCPQEVAQALRRVHRSGDDSTDTAWWWVMLPRLWQRPDSCEPYDCSPNPAIQWAANISDDTVRWACAMAVSRNFGGELYPLIDMANHAPDEAHGLNVRPIRWS